MKLQTRLTLKTEPLNEDGSPHTAKLEKVVKLEMEDKMVDQKNS